MSSPPPVPDWAMPRIGPVVVPLNSGKMTAKVLLGGVFCALLGGGAVVSGLLGKMEGGSGVQVAGIIVGSLFLLLGLFILWGSRKVARPRRFVVEPEGLRYEDTGGPSWAVRWGELARVSLHVGYHQGRPISPRTFRVRLELAPTDPGFASRHPTMARYAGRFGAGQGYGMPLGPDRALVDQLDAGLRAFAGRAYGGVVDDGQVIGFGYV